MITPNTKIIFYIDFETGYCTKETISTFISNFIMQSEIFDKLDELWCNENDKILEFYYAADGSYLFKKSKLVVNPRNIEEQKWVEYTWHELSSIDVKNFYDVILNAFEKSLEIEFLEKQEYLSKNKTNIETTPIESVKRRRQDLLSQTDWMFSSDIQNIMNKEKLKLWEEYRQKLRDIPSDNKLELKPWKWLIPITPDEWEKLNNEVTEEYKKENNYSVEAPYLSVRQHYITGKEDIKRQAENLDFSGKESLKENI